MFVIPTMMVITDGGVTHKLELKNTGNKDMEQAGTKKTMEDGRARFSFMCHSLLYF